MGSLQIFQCLNVAQKDSTNSTRIEGEEVMIFHEFHDGKWGKERIFRPESKLQPTD